MFNSLIAAASLLSLAFLLIVFAVLAWNSPLLIAITVLVLGWAGFGARREFKNHRDSLSEEEIK